MFEELYESVSTITALPVRLFKTAKGYEVTHGYATVFKSDNNDFGCASRVYNALIAGRSWMSEITCNN